MQIAQTTYTERARQHRHNRYNQLRLRVTDTMRLCANALAAIAAWQVAQWTMTLRRVQGVKLVKQVELLHAGARSGGGWNWTRNGCSEVIQSTSLWMQSRILALQAANYLPSSKKFPFHLATRRGGRPTAGQPMARPGGRATGGPSSSSPPAGGRAAAGRAGGSSSSAAPGRSAAGAQRGAAGGAGAGRGGPQAVRRQLLRRALRQRRQAQKMRRGGDTIDIRDGLIPLMRNFYKELDMGITSTLSHCHYQGISFLEYLNSYSCRLPDPGIYPVVDEKRWGQMGSRPRHHCVGVDVEDS